MIKSIYTSHRLLDIMPIPICFLKHKTNGPYLRKTRMKHQNTQIDNISKCVDTALDASSFNVKEGKIGQAFCQLTKQMVGGESPFTHMIALKHTHTHTTHGLYGECRMQSMRQRLRELKCVQKKGVLWVTCWLSHFLRTMCAPEKARRYDAHTAKD